MSFLLIERGITKLSQLQIDTDKDWGGKGITNIRHIAAGAGIGHVAQHNGLILETLPPGLANYVLTSAGPGNRVVWMPGGMYLNRYFPVFIALSKATQKPFTASRVKNIASPMAAPYGLEERVNPSWFHRLEPAISILRGTQKPFSPAHTQDLPKTLAGRLITLDMPVNGAVADDGGVQTDETASGKSRLSRDQYYSVNDDSYIQLGSSSAWEAQTFTTALMQRVRGVRLKLWRQNIYSYPGTVTVGIRAVDGSNHPTGPDLCQGTFDGNTIQWCTSAESNWVYIPFTTSYVLSNGTRYAIVLRCASGSLLWQCDQTSPTYAAGNREYSSNSGTSWTTDTAKDFMFEVCYTLDDMTLLPAALAMGDAYYWGYDEKFKRIYQDIGIAGAGTYLLAFEYSRGAGVWANCVDLVDGTGKFQNLGQSTISHTPQADWAKDTVSGRNVYWIRAKCTDAGAGYSQPLGTYALVSMDF